MEGGGGPRGGNWRRVLGIMKVVGAWRGADTEGRTWAAGEGIGVGVQPVGGS